jgi:GT2 family glycosyltransferase
VTMLASEESDAGSVTELIERIVGEPAERFTVIDPSDAEAWHAPFAGSSGDALLGVLARGDELGVNALSAFAIASGIHTRADCFYADEFRLMPGSGRPDAFFKPDFSPALLLSTNYIGRPIVLRPSLAAAAGVSAHSLTRDGFHDLALRCTEAAAETYHLSELLSRTDGGEAPNVDDGAALTEAMKRRGVAAAISPGIAPETWRVRRTAQRAGKVSIVIPTRGTKSYIETCVNSLRAMTAYRNYEIICIDNIPESEAACKSFVRQHADKIVEMAPPFNWSRFNNQTAQAAEGEFLLFLNDDVEVDDPGWLDAMLEAASWPGVGIVGARLLYPNRTVQHAGMFLGDGIGRHAFRHAAETDPGYFGLALTQREVIAVTGACLLVRRETFDQLGRFDEAHDVVNNDLDFCLRAHRAGLRTIYTPYATLIHHERSSRDHLPDNHDTVSFARDWRGKFASGDPFFNPRLSRYFDD